jgi:exopolysaccharide production protein ExoZ
MAMIGLYIALPSLSHGQAEWGYLTSLTLIPTEKRPALFVAWSLIHEMLFYNIFFTSGDGAESLR